MIDTLNIDQTTQLLELLDEHIAGLRRGEISATYFAIDRGLELAATLELRNMLNTPRAHSVAELSTIEVNLLADLLDEYADGVKNGEISGFGQSPEDEFSDVMVIRDVLIDDNN